MIVRCLTVSSTLIVAALAVPGLCMADGHFKKAPRTFQVGPNPNAIVAVDLNDDGLPEILAASRGVMGDLRQEVPSNNEVTFLLAAGILDYDTETPLRTGYAPYAIAVGNVDALKAPDVLVACFLATKHRDVWLFRNMGDNLFESSSFTIQDDALSYERIRDAEDKPVFTKPGLTSLVLDDFNGDGFRDVVAAGWSSDVLVYLPGQDGAASFGAPTFVHAAKGPRDLRAADFDGDGNLDLAVALYSSNELGIWRGGGQGAFEPATHFSTRGRLPNRVRVSDVNGDKKLDLIVSHCYTDDSIVLSYGDGGFDFGMSREIMLGTNREVLEHEIRDLIVTDLNGDGRPDIAAACYGSSQVIVLFNESEDASLPQVFAREVHAYEEGKPRALCTADFNNDGVLDIGVALWEENAVSVLLGKPPEEEEK